MLCPVKTPSWISIADRWVQANCISFWKSKTLSNIATQLNHRTSQEYNRFLYWASILSRSLQNCLWFNPRDNIKLNAFTTILITSFIKCHRICTKCFLVKNYLTELLIPLLSLKWHSKGLTKLLILPTNAAAPSGVTDISLLKYKFISTSARREPINTFRPVVVPLSGSSWINSSLFCIFRLYLWQR